MACFQAPCVTRITEIHILQADMRDNVYMPEIHLVLTFFFFYSQSNCSEKQTLCQWYIQVVEDFGPSGCSMEPGLLLYIFIKKGRND